MVKRLLSAVVAIPLGLLMLYINSKILYVSAFSVLGVMAVYEVLLATKYVQNKVLSVFALVFAFAVPYMFCFQGTRENIIMLSFAFVIGLFCIMLFMHDKVSFAQVTLVGFIVVCVPLSFISMEFLWELAGEHGMFCILYVLAVTWLSDAGAYFVGSSIGKHKMAPKISPKKTWEGFFGGVVFAGVFAALLCYGYKFVMKSLFETSVQMDIKFLVVTGLLCSALGVLGDLSASIIKRECSVKDFGNIMPGHGGVLDRFDSILFAAPFVYLLFQVYFPIMK